MHSGSKDKSTIVTALTAVAAGILTDVLYNVIAENYYKAEIMEGSINIFKISKYSILYRDTSIYNQ